MINSRGQCYNGSLTCCHSEPCSHYTTALHITLHKMARFDVRYMKKCYTTNFQDFVAFTVQIVASCVLISQISTFRKNVLPLNSKLKESVQGTSIDRNAGRWHASTTTKGIKIRHLKRSEITKYVSSPRIFETSYTINNKRIHEELQDQSSLFCTSEHDLTL